MLWERAGECFSAMLLDYDNVQVQTIDSFLQTLLSGLASILKLDVGLQTELDINHIVTTAVDQLITVEMTDEVQRMIEDYLMVKLDNDTRWDMRKSIRSMAMEMYNESVQMLEAEGQIEFQAEVIEQCRKKIEESLETHPLRAEIEAQLAILGNYADLRRYSCAPVTAKPSPSTYRLIDLNAMLMANGRSRAVNIPSRYVLMRKTLLNLKKCLFPVWM